MSDQPRSLPSRPNLRYLKLEAKRRLAAGEFPTLHDAQLAVAREHGLSSWAALKQRIEGGLPRPDGNALAQLRWVVSRFHGSDRPGWSPPGADELRLHFSDAMLGSFDDETVAVLTSVADRLQGKELVVSEDSPSHAHVRVPRLQVHAVATDEPPHGLVALQVRRLDTITDARVAAPTTRTAGTAGTPGAPAAAAVAEQMLAELGLVGLSLAGGSPDTPTVWALARGWADLEQDEELRPDHRFPVGAVTRLVTATAVLRLVAAGRLRLDDPANGHLRTVRLADGTVTVRELLAHGGGVSTPSALLTDDAVPDLVSLVGPLMPCSGPRGEATNSRGGYAALGQLIADLSGAPYPESAARLVLDPLGMDSSFFPGRRPDAASGGVTGYDLAAGGTLVPALAKIFTVPSSDGLWSTAADLARFGLGWSSLLPADLVAEALTPQAARPLGAVGLGWFLDRTGEMAGLPGVAPGSSASLVVRVRDGRTHAALSNRLTPVESVNGRVLRAMDRAAAAADDRACDSL